LEELKMNHRIKHSPTIISLCLIALFGLSACAGSPAPSPTATPTLAPTVAPTPAPTSAPASALAVSPAQETVLKISRDSKLGDILTDNQGMTLYLYKQDGTDSSNCTGACAQQHPPLTVPQGVEVLADKGIAGNIGVTERTDGTYQVLYNDSPLYRFSGDKKPGDINGAGNDWSVVLVPPAASAATPTAEVTDWTARGFPTVLVSQEIANGSAATLAFGPYSIFVPQGAFTDTVKFDLLSGDPLAFASKMPGDQTPVLAFAFNVRDARTNQLIGKFAQPVMLTVKDSRIAADSGCYNVAANGDLSINMTGVQVQAGELTHPIAGAVFGWVITAPKTTAHPG
jgi:predicted lipoprotein with Yx(FWY)xxD motif